MSLSLSAIVALLMQYRYIFLFPILVVEGPIITVIAGFLVSLGIFDFTVTYIIAIIGDLVGDAFYYYIGKFGRIGLIDRWGPYLGASKERVEKLSLRIKQNTAKVLIGGKLTQGLGAIILMAAGMAEIPFGKFIWYNFLPTIPKSLLFLLIGFYFGQAYARIAKYLDYTAVIMGVAAVLFILIWFAIRWITKKSVKIEE